MEIVRAFFCVQCGYVNVFLCGCIDRIAFVVHFERRVKRGV